VKLFGQPVHKAICASRARISFRYDGADDLPSLILLKIVRHPLPKISVMEQGFPPMLILLELSLRTKLLGPRPISFALDSDRMHCRQGLLTTA
jgi:hypothetical protein